MSPFHFLTVNVNYCPIDLIRSIYDPEHPNSLEELRVVSAPQVEVGENRVMVEFTPTVPHCGMSTLIGLQKNFLCSAHPPTHTVFVPGLSIRVRLLRSLPERYKVDIRVKPGSHQSEVACAYDLWRLRYRMLTFSVQVNKQLNDKERVAAALENPTLLATVEQTLIDAGRRGQPG